MASSKVWTIPTILVALAAVVAIASSLSFRGSEARETKQEMRIENLEKCYEDITPKIVEIRTVAKKNESLLIVINTRLNNHYGLSRKASSESRSSFRGD